ncbi:MAG: 2-C-methyl-D-erythritol 4-phosphate cytidylyltransferase [Gloeobacteraceae cyanobacterium ES-bin-144]|nr:2-C-methyl-D-erythritol 4-phosphate cytidylyltransferase [Verrucomicrobiales bacterium]
MNDVECIILAGGSGTRLGMGPKAFIKLGGMTLLERAVQPMLVVSSKVIVALPKTQIPEGDALMNDDRVTLIAGGERRSDTFRLLVKESRAEWLILHDVVHPCVTAELTQTVLDAAYASGAAAATYVVTEFLYNPDGAMVARPEQSLIVQKPIAFRSSVLKTGIEKADALGLTHDIGILEFFSLAGVTPTFVKGHPWNQKITYPEDLELAEPFVPKMNSWYS